METIQRTEITDIGDIAPGDCVYIHGRWRTLDKKDVRTGLTGKTICGDPFALEGRKIKRALFPRYYKGEVVGWYSQL